MVKIITLCGSTKFKDEFDRQNRLLTLSGNAVFSLAGFEHVEGTVLSEEQICILAKVHETKIDISDEILVINKGGYIGSSTRLEIEYARSKGKIVRYLEE